MQALYQAAKENPAAVATEMLKALKDLPKEYYDKGADIVSASFVGDSDDDFYNSGKATTELGFEAVAAIVSAGGAVVIKKGIGKSLDIEIIPPDRNPNRNNNGSNGNANYDAGNGNNSSNSSSKNKPNSQSTNVNQNFNYQDYINDNAPDLSEYDANSPNSLDQFSAEQAAKRKAYEAEAAKNKADTEAYIARSEAESKARQDQWNLDQADHERKADDLTAKNNAIFESLGIPTSSSRMPNVNNGTNGSTIQRSDGSANSTVDAKIAEADAIMAQFNRAKANGTSSINSSTNGVNSTPNPMVINGCSGIIKLDSV